MSTISGPDWTSIRERARAFPESAFEFVRQGLAYTVERRELEGACAGVSGGAGSGSESVVRAGGVVGRHVTGRELSLGLRDFALARYGLLAGVVLRSWGFRRTEDFGVVVYAMIERGEMRASSDDTPEDFREVFDFDAAFGRV